MKRKRNLSQSKRKTVEIIQLVVTQHANNPHQFKKKVFFMIFIQNSLFRKIIFSIFLFITFSVLMPFFIIPGFINFWFLKNISYFLFLVSYSVGSYTRRNGEKRDKNPTNIGFNEFSNIV